MRGTSEKWALTAVELERLAEDMPSERDRVLTLVLGWTGVRFGEGIALQRGDVDILRRRLRISRAVSDVAGTTVVGTPKSHQGRSVALPRSVADALGAYMANIEPGPSALLFPNEVGGYLRPKWKLRVFDKAAARAKLTPPPLRVHDLRHTAASLWIASGANIKVLQQHLGHKTASMTLDVYGHLMPDEVDAQADRLDALRTAAPADSVRTVPGDADVVAIGNRP